MILKQISLTLILFMINSAMHNINAQSPKIDSLSNLLKLHTKADTVRVNLLNETADNLYRFDIEKTFIYVNEANRISEELDYKKGQAESLRLVGLYYLIKQDFLKALENYQEAILTSPEIG